MSRNHDQDLPEELYELECQLRKLAPASMPCDLTARIERSMVASTITGSNHSQVTLESLEELEIHLEQLAPATMPEDLINRMVRAMDNWHEDVPEEEKLVSFSSRGSKQKSSRKPYSLGMLSLAAGVALLGALTALVTSGLLENKAPVMVQNGGVINNSNGPLPANAVADTTAGSEPGVFPILSLNALQTIGRSAARLEQAAPASAAIASNDRVIGDSLKQQVISTSDQGVVVAGDNMPHRCIRVEYLDTVIVENSEGRQVKRSRPGVKYVLLPMEIY